MEINTCGAHSYIDPPDECPHCMKKDLRKERLKVDFLLNLLNTGDTPGSTSGVKRLFMEEFAEAEVNKALASEWVFVLRDDLVCVSPKEHWEEKGYIPDTHCGEDFMPDTWVECMDHAYELRSDINYSGSGMVSAFARNEFTRAGLTEVKWEDGEAARRASYLKELAEDGFTEDENGEIVPITT